MGKLSKETIILGTRTGTLQTNNVKHHFSWQTYKAGRSRQYYSLNVSGHLKVFCDTILNQTKTKMYLGAPRNVTWDKDSNSSLFIWKETLGNTCRGTGKTGKRRRPIKSVLSNKLLLWSGGAYPSRLPTPSLSHISHLHPKPQNVLQPRPTL